MTTEDEAIDLLFKWVSQGDHRRFAIEYGWGVCEEVVVSLRDAGREVGRALVGKDGLLSAVRKAIETPLNHQPAGA